MLYERWREMVERFSSACAVLDLSRGGAWTFRELDTLAETRRPAPVMFPQSPAPDFIADVICAWKHRSVACPLEPGQAQPEFPPPPKHIAHLKITSASTGPARLVACTGEQLAADAQNIVQTMGLRRDWPNLGVISMAHSYGFSNLITPLLLHGIPLVVADSALPESIRNALEAISGVTLPGVPALWRAWFEAGALSSERVRLAISAGASLPLVLEQEIFDRHGLKVHNFYGASECGGIAYDGSPKPRTDAAFIGAPMKNVGVAIADDGCLEAHSDAVAETYWPEPDPRLGRGRFHTTDLAEIIGDAVYLRGRSSDVINVAGRKVAPEIIEAALRRHPGVAECVVFGVAEGDRERIVACVASKSVLSAGELRQFLLDVLPSWQIPRDFRFVETLAPDQRGKLSRAAWRARYVARA